MGPVYKQWLAVVGPFLLVPPATLTRVPLLTALLRWGQFRHNLEEHETGDPATLLLYPLFDSHGNDRKGVGLILSTIYWRLTFSDSLPSSDRGVIAVLEHKREDGETVTYRIDWEEAKLLGTDDLHDRKFDSMGRVLDVGEFVRARASPETRSYTAVELDTDFNTYTLAVYPSEDYQALYRSNEPRMFALVIAAIFMFTICVFLSYDYVVETRQKKLHRQAVKSSAVVASLYPQTVRDRLYEEKERELPKSQRKKRDRVQEFMDNGCESTAFGVTIADTFDDATNFFLDLVGFTKWSSSRQATQVFHLLERYVSPIVMMYSRQVLHTCALWNA